MACGPGNDHMQCILHAQCVTLQGLALTIDTCYGACRAAPWWFSTILLQCLSRSWHAGDAVGQETTIKSVLHMHVSSAAACTNMASSRHHIVCAVPQWWQHHAAHDVHGSHAGQQCVDLTG